MATVGGGADQSAHRAAVAFNDAINCRDLEALEELMTDGHTFVDADGNVLSGKDEVLDAWRGFFAAFSRGCPAAARDAEVPRAHRLGTVMAAEGREEAGDRPAAGHKRKHGPRRK